MNRHDVRTLQQIRGYPALSITMPTHRSAPENRQDPIRLKSLVKQATDRLPLAVVGVDRYLAFFKEVSDHRDAILTTDA